MNSKIVEKGSLGSLVGKATGYSLDTTDESEFESKYR
jgi:hypothetical protein